MSRYVLPDTNVINTSTETVLVKNMPSPNGNHNAGDVKFGKDGDLYISNGFSIVFRYPPGVDSGIVVAGGGIYTGDGLPATAAVVRRFFAVNDDSRFGPSSQSSADLFGLQSELEQVLAQLEARL